MKINYLNNKKIMFLGLGLTTYESVIALEEYKENIIIVDNKASGSYYDELNSKGYKIIKEEKAKNLNIDLIVKSPGISFEHDILIFYKNIEVLNDIELAYIYLQECKSKTKIIAITGTNGKTSTSLFIEHLLTKVPFKAKTAGNIGVSPLKILNEYKDLDFLVLELSSFQLKSIKNFRANISILLNITPDHLNMHSSFKDYVDSKKNIYKNSLKEDYLLVKPKVFENFLKEEKILPKILTNDVDSSIKEKIDQKNIIEINFNNLLLTYQLCKILNIKDEIFFDSIDTFKGLEHRVEYVDTIKGIKFYNDSKSTNLPALKQSVSKFNNIILLVGGKKTDEDLSKFDNYLTNVKKVICYGENKELFKSEKIIKCFENLDDALNLAFEEAIKGDTVLLSPASKSFDQYENYIKRGEDFKNIVKGLKK